VTLRLSRRRRCDASQSPEQGHGAPVLARRSGVWRAHVTAQLFRPARSARRLRRRLAHRARSASRRRRRSCEPPHSVTILHAAIAHPLGGAGYPAAAIAERRDVATGRGSAGDLAALVPERLLLRDGWSRQQRQGDCNGYRPHLSTLPRSLLLLAAAPIMPRPTAPKIAPRRVLINAGIGRMSLLGRTGHAGIAGMT